MKHTQRTRTTLSPSVDIAGGTRCVVRKNHLPCCNNELCLVLTWRDAVFISGIKVYRNSYLTYHLSSCFAIKWHISYFLNRGVPVSARKGSLFKEQHYISFGAKIVLKLPFSTFTQAIFISCNDTIIIFKIERT